MPNARVGVRGAALGEEEDTEAVAGVIQRYLASHPLAADTVEGVARWWIPRQRLEETLARTEAALERLVVRGVVERTEIGGRVVYRRLEAPRHGAT
jgi:hypothetical protein